MRSKNLLALTILIFAASLLSFRLSAKELNIIVLGVIASSQNKGGVALIKNTESGKVSAHHEGSYVKPGLEITKVGRKSVIFKIEENLYTMKVGDYNATETPQKETEKPRNTLTVENLRGVEGIERNGNRLRVSENVKKALVGDNLSKVLMQAAAIPATDAGGRLIGFKLLAIDKGSIYDVAGLKDGDIITHINDQPIISAGSAIKALNQLKGAQQARFSYNRAGSAQELIIDTQ